MSNATGSTAITTPDGRVITFREFGAEGGLPVVHCHGGVECRLFEVDAAWTERAGVRVIVPDRPGFGESDPQPGRTVVGWVDDDLSLLAAHLGLERFAVLGWSAGGRYAVAAAARLRDRVSALALVAPSAPITRPGGYESLSDQDRLVVDLAGQDRDQAERAVAAFVASTWVPHPESFLGSGDDPPGDKAVLEHPEWGENLRAQVREAFRRPDGVASDHVLSGLPWGVDLAAVRCPADVWLGGDDPLVPGHATWLAEVIPGARLHLVPHEGHLVIYPAWRPIIETLVSAGRDRLGRRDPRRRETTEG